MKRFGKAGKILLAGIVMLSLHGLTGCCKKVVILQDAATIRILPGDLKTSPGFKGWALSDQATAKLLEKAEACQGVK